MKLQPFLTENEITLNAQFRFEVRTVPSDEPRRDDYIPKYRVYSKATDEPVNNCTYHSWARAQRECDKLHDLQ